MCRDFFNEMILKMDFFLLRIIIFLANQYPDRQGLPRRAEGSQNRLLGMAEQDMTKICIQTLSWTAIRL